MPRMPTDRLQQGLADAIAFTYDRVHVRREDVLRRAAERGFPGLSWQQYREQASGKLMDAIADSYIRPTNLTVTAAGAASGLAGLPGLLPDALQFLALTLRMVTGIAAAYGFDPDPDARQGAARALVLQAYVNAHFGRSAKKATESLTLAAAARGLRHATNRAGWILDLMLFLARLIGLRITRQGLIRGIPVVASGVNAGFNWYHARKIARSAREEFREFREQIWRGAGRHDPEMEEWRQSGD